MKLYIKQKVFSWGDKFTVKDEFGQDKYYVEGQVWSFGKKLHVYDMSGAEVAFIRQKVTMMFGEYHVELGGTEVAVIRQKFSWFRPKYQIDGPGWQVEGSFWAHDYDICQSGTPVVTIRKEWMTWGDSYELDIANPEDEILALAAVLVIDCVLASSNH